VIVIDGDEMEHLAYPNVNMYPDVSKFEMEWRVSRNIDVYRALSSYSCEIFTWPWCLAATLLSSPSSLTIG
jgi:hypothetical protein